MAKDRFSQQSSTYAKYRPTYPPELYAYILGFVNGRDCAWDCATGNGQAARELANFFRTVEATDISEAQLQNAVQQANIHYHLSPAERTPFADNSFDLITIATAYHWLDWKAFHTEATRVGKPGCVVAAWAYNLLSSPDEGLNSLIRHFYREVVGAYWDKERRYIENSYATVEFDFAPLPTREFTLQVEWNRDAFLGYLASWSAVQNYQKARGTSPLPEMETELRRVWPSAEVHPFRFPLFLKTGRVQK